MKYVIFKHKDLLMPVIIPDHVTHSQVKLEESEIVSAGFFKVDRFGLITTYGNSESLKIGPREDDYKILEAVFSDSGTSSFLDF